MADDDLDLIPRGVRDKLDRVGIKLHLKQWELFSHVEREWLRDAPCTTTDEIATYVAELDRLVTERTGRPAQRLN